MVLGITESKLLSAVLEGDDRNVPVGRKVISHDPSRNPDDVMPLSRGQEITNFHLDQFDAFGTSRTGKKAIRENDTEEDLGFSAREIVNNGLLVEASFDQSTGSLVLVRRNGEIFTIDGLLTQSDFGRGCQGSRGECGYNAFDGYDAEDGKDGDTGCPGEEGECGEDGLMGESGADGPQGIPGPSGAQGERGSIGPVGDVGRYGHEGARGPKGLSCQTEPGPEGPPGNEVTGHVVISATEPDSTVRLWGIPE